MYKAVRSRQRQKMGSSQRTRPHTRDYEVSSDRSTPVDRRSNHNNHNKTHTDHSPADMQASTPARGSVRHGEQDRGGHLVWLTTQAGTQSHGQARRTTDTWSGQPGQGHGYPRAGGGRGGGQPKPQPNPPPKPQPAKPQPRPNMSGWW